MDQGRGEPERDQRQRAEHAQGSFAEAFVETDLGEQRANHGERGAQTQRHQEDGGGDQRRAAFGGRSGRPCHNCTSLLDDQMSDIYTVRMELSGPVRQAPLVLQVSGQFRALIESGAWPLGLKIPGENQLATELGVSRGTVREALRSLSLTGLLEPRVGDGTYVRATNEITGVLVRDDLSALDHVLDTRALL